MSQESFAHDLLVIFALLHLQLEIHVELEQVNRFLRHVLKDLVQILRFLDVRVVPFNIEEICFDSSTFGFKVDQSMEVVITISMLLLANHTPGNQFLLVYQLVASLWCDGALRVGQESLH